MLGYDAALCGIKQRCLARMSILRIYVLVALHRYSFVIYSLLAASESTLIIF